MVANSKSKKPFKLTNQRAIICKYLEGNKTHPTVDDIYNHVKKRLPQISKKTVYSNLSFLSLNRIIKELNIKGVRRYEPNLKPHAHAICRVCGKIIDLESVEYIENPKIKDFILESTSLTYYGVCKKCKGGEKYGRK